MGENTNLLHSYPVIDPYTGASSIPKYQASTFSQNELYCSKQAYSYTRFGNPTIDALEKGFATLTKADYALAYASGMAAISNILMLLNSGEHIILPIEVYGGTCQFVINILPKFKIEFSFVDMSCIETIEKNIQPNTKMIYIETPSNPLLKVVDIKKVVRLAKSHKIMTVADNTFMTALYQQPLSLGIDIVMESATKFINGHSDVVAGLIATNNAVLYKELTLFQKNFGGILGIEDAWLVLRGLKTMGIRLERSVSNAEKIAEFLNNHPNVNKVYYPSLVNHPNAHIQKQQAKNGGAVLSFELSKRLNINDFIRKLRLPILAVSLGGVESILSHPATMSHGCLPEEKRIAQGITDTLLRLSCGIEDVEDLINDLNQALKP